MIGKNNLYYRRLTDKPILEEGQAEVPVTEEETLPKFGKSPSFSKFGMSPSFSINKYSGNIPSFLTNFFFEGGRGSRSLTSLVGIDLMFFVELRIAA